jgi:precorrin-2 dehydrogenase/sirohydrochlorin ferrochelatase
MIPQALPMLPITLDQSALRMGVAGAGAPLERRLAMLDAGGVKPQWVHRDRLPSDAEITALHLFFVAGLDDGVSAALAATARRARVLVNVEDRPALCDFHVPASVRRGDLILTVSTGGRSPGVARLVREDLERRFGPQWGTRLDEMAELRRLWREEGLAPDLISERTRAFIGEKGWLA